MGSTTVVNEIAIRTSPEELFDYVSSPGRWPEWHPSSRELAMDRDPRGPQKQGDTYSEEIKAGGRRGRLDWEVTACERPRLWIARAESDQGATITLRYDIDGADDGAGLRFRRTLTYELRPLFLKIANQVFMKWKIRRESTQALENLKRVVEGE